MTHNQIAYFQAQETQRSNLATEKETNRANLARENEINRNNRAVEAETNRHNLATEYETSRNNRAQLLEGSRHNYATENNAAMANAINQSHYVRQDYNQYLGVQETGRHNRHSEYIGTGQLSESRRSNRAKESLSETLNAINARNAKIAQQNADTNRLNAEVNRWNLSNRLNIDLQRIPYELAEYSARTQKWINDANLSATKESVIPVELGYQFLNSMTGFGRMAASYK